MQRVRKPLKTRSCLQLGAEGEVFKTNLGHWALDKPHVALRRAEDTSYICQCGAIGLFDPKPYVIATPESILCGKHADRRRRSCGQRSGWCERVCVRGSNGAGRQTGVQVRSAHDGRIYIGDIKEDNLLLSYLGRVIMVSDFGCSFLMKN